MRREFRVFGPPGTGKTTYLTRQIEKAHGKYGDSMIVASFTKAAARELVSRGLPLPRECVGTLHALCYHALDEPTIAESKIDEFNSTWPQFRLSGEKIDVEDPHGDPGGEKTNADDLMYQYQVWRAMMKDRAIMPSHVSAFATKWEEWKRESGYFDFTDLIEKGLELVPVAPGNPKVGFFDEAQDFTPLELSLVRQWAESMEWMILVGDDDQCLYRFKGATPSAFLEPEVDPSMKTILSRSWRVPRLIQRKAKAWIETCSRREPKEYKGRDEDGSIRKIPVDYGVPGVLISEIDERYLWDGSDQTVMILTACSYMLSAVITELRDRGIPFHNPFRRKRGDWNPLKRSSRGTSSSDMVLSFTAASTRSPATWTAAEFRTWVKQIKVKGALEKGWRDELSVIDTMLEDEEAEDVYMDEDWIRMILTEEAFTRGQQGDLSWLEDHVKSTRRKGLEYPVRVYEKRGRKALSESPRVCVGTIHSVKGGEADAVYLFPDVSFSGFKEWNMGGESRDSVIRQFYVGMTRARRDLVVCRPRGPMSVMI
tara:strand:- start:263 stop:1882 length:1620 start_codon:yes stop_codon:yes gene_type:complete